MALEPGKSMCIRKSSAYAFETVTVRWNERVMQLCPGYLTKCQVTFTIYVKETLQGA
jgi:hypothetical protein